MKAAFLDLNYLEILIHDVTMNDFYRTKKHVASRINKLRLLTISKFQESVAYSLGKAQHFGLCSSLHRALHVWAKRNAPAENWDPLKTSIRKKNNSRGRQQLVKQSG